ncbi:hypothetical protein F441_03331 [Phytophthora nicotianae CJ01A1]|uniref:Uncharacterized protein n=1 Tax=Phytophthora nicotianae CJ01A1 TaxID=1317063 RepID=W2XKZ6_PHYNI|nr:hypothetical protein F441_03331 [Phytophthora nicotianae CJ01A1]
MESIQHVIEEDGILASERGDGKLAAIFNMDLLEITSDSVSLMLTSAEGSQ